MPLRLDLVPDEQITPFQGRLSQSGSDDGSHGRKTQKGNIAAVVHVAVGINIIGQDSSLPDKLFITADLFGQKSLEDC